MCQFRSNFSSGASRPSPHLDIEMTKTQAELLAPGWLDLAEGQMMKEAGLLGEKKKLPARKLNLVGEINDRTVVANTPNRVARLKSSLQLAKSIDEVKRVGNEEKALKKQRAHEEMGPVAEVGLARLRDGVSIDTLTVKQLVAVAHIKMNTAISQGSKALIVSKFRDAMATTGWGLPSQVALLEPGAGDTVGVEQLSVEQLSAAPGPAPVPLPHASGTPNAP